MKHLLAGISAVALVAAGVSGGLAQSGSLDQAVGGYSFEDAAKSAPATADFNSADGKLTFAIFSPTPINLIGTLNRS